MMCEQWWVSEDRRDDESQKFTKTTTSCLHEKWEKSSTIFQQCTINPLHSKRGWYLRIMLVTYIYIRISTQGTQRILTTILSSGAEKNEIKMMISALTSQKKQNNNNVPTRVFLTQCIFWRMGRWWGFHAFKLTGISGKKDIIQCDSQMDFHKIKWHH